MLILILRRLFLYAVKTVLGQNIAEHNVTSFNVASHNVVE
jgi:hypothetical protein